MSFTVKVSDRSMRRVQIVMAAVQAADQTAKAATEAANSMVAQARKSLDEALGSICDAHDEVLPENYTLTLRVKDDEITITDNTVPPPQPTVVTTPLNEAEPPNGLAAYEAARDAP